MNITLHPTVGFYCADLPEAKDSLEIWHGNNSIRNCSRFIGLLEASPFHQLVHSCPCHTLGGYEARTAPYKKNQKNGTGSLSITGKCDLRQRKCYRSTLLNHMSHPFACILSICTPNSTPIRCFISNQCITCILKSQKFI